jgi:hypothetical protein
MSVSMVVVLALTFVQMLVRIGKMDMAASAELTRDIIESEEQECTAGDAWEPIPDGVAELGAEPGDAKA